MVSSRLKNEIIQQFHERVSASSLSKVHIKDIVDALDINRNSFYYHFDNKYDVAIWIFRHDLAKKLSHAAPEKYLISMPVNNSNDSEPFFIRNHRRAMNETPFMMAFAHCLLDDVQFYRQVFTLEEPELITSLTEMYENVIYKELSAQQDITNTDKTFIGPIASIRAISIIMGGVYLLRPSTNVQKLLDDPQNPFWEIPYKAV